MWSRFTSRIVGAGSAALLSGIAVHQQAALAQGSALSVDERLARLESQAGLREPALTGTRSTKILVPFGTDVLKDEVVFTESELKAACHRLAAEINADYASLAHTDDEVIIMGLLAG
jgi:hypothetical protein